VNITLKQADQVVSAYMARMQPSSWNAPVVQAVAMLAAIKQVFGEQVTVVHNVTPEETPA
jgi:hypothetical protein